MNKHRLPELERVKRNTRIVELYKEGVSLNDISERFGLVRNWVQYIIRNTNDSDNNAPQPF